MSYNKRTRIKNVDMLRGEFLSVGGGRKRFKIIKDGEKICSSDGMGGYFPEHDYYCVTNESGEWQVFYEDKNGKREVLKSCRKEAEACTFFYDLLAEGKVPQRSAEYSADTVYLSGDAVLYFSERGSSETVKKLDSPNKAESYLKNQNKKRK